MTEYERGFAEGFERGFEAGRVAQVKIDSTAQTLWEGSENLRDWWGIYKDQFGKSLQVGVSHEADPAKC